MTLNSQTHILEAAQLKPLLTPTPRDIKCFRTWNITTDHQGKQCQGRPKSNLKRPCSQTRIKNKKYDLEGCHPGGTGSQRVETVW